jgi:hypothetical protein
LQYRTLATGK